MAAPALPAALVIDVGALQPALLVMTVLPAALVGAVSAVGSSVLLRMGKEWGGT